MYSILSQPDFSSRISYLSPGLTRADSDELIDGSDRTRSQPVGVSCIVAVWEEGLVEDLIVGDGAEVALGEASLSLVVALSVALSSF